MKFIRKYLIAGSLVVLPVIITVFVFLWLFSFLDGILGKYINSYLMSQYGYKIPGLGIIFAIALILFVGFLVTHLISRGFISFFEKFFLKFPIIKQIYPAVKQMIYFLFSDRRLSFRKVVLIEYPRKGVYTLGFLTNETLELFKQKTRKDLINIFIPSTPGPLTGYLVMVPKAEVVIVDIAVEEALKMLISGGVVNPSQKSTESLPF